MSSAAVVRGASTESLEEKLATVTEYAPKAGTPVEQLVEVARRFKIPMGIEWVDRSGTPAPDKTPASRKRSVRELIEEIASASPEHRVAVDGGLVRIYSTVAAVHSFNFLNIRLGSYSVKDADLFDAQDRLRWAIRFTLEPQKYRHGSAGGYGYGVPNVFQFPKFTIPESELTIRDVLDRIALAQGNALWIATIKSEDLEGDRPFWNRKEKEGAHLPLTSSWRFLPLAEIAELAPERVAVDVTIAGLLDERMTTIPVMLEHGLAGDSGGGAGGGSSNGISFQYGASIEKIGKDFVTLSVHLKVERSGEPDFNFDKKLRIKKDAITDVQPESRIRIRAYFEPAEKP